MKKLIATLSFTLLALLAAASADAQTALTQTTLAAAVTTTSQKVILVTSATGITAPSLSAGTSTQIFVDTELMDVEAVNGVNITVRRGAAGTKAATHNSGAPLYAGLSNYFSATDRSGSCTSGNELVLPVINTVTGRIWDCRSSGAWIQIGAGTGSTGAAEAFRAMCTGTAGSAETEYLNLAACSGATASTTRYLVPSTGTIANLRVYSSANAVGGSGKDVLTVYKNGSSTALTCTIAASAAACNDAAHSVAVAAGDVLTFQFVTATSDTAANLAVSVEKF